MGADSLSGGGLLKYVVWVVWVVWVGEWVGHAGRLGAREGGPI